MSAKLSLQYQTEDCRIPCLLSSQPSDTDWLRKLTAQISFLQLGRLSQCGNKLSCIETSGIAHFSSVLCREAILLAFRQFFTYLFLVNSITKVYSNSYCIWYNYKICPSSFVLHRVLGLPASLGMVRPRRG